MRRNLVHLFATVLFVAGMVSVASATLVAVDAPFVTQSWDQKFQISNNESFDKMEFFSTSGFGLPGARSFSDSSWTNTYLGTYYGAAAGNNLSNLLLNMHFLGDPSSSAQFVLALWDGNNRIETDQGSYDGHSWSISGFSGNLDDLRRTCQVPEPGTLALLGSGLLGLAIYSRRRVKK